MGRCECCRVEKGAAAASFHAGSPSDLDLPDEQPVLATRTTSSSWFESERAFFGVTLLVRVRVERKGKGQAMRASSATMLEGDAVAVWL